MNPPVFLDTWLHASGHKTIWLAQLYSDTVPASTARFVDESMDQSDRMDLVGFVPETQDDTDDNTLEYRIGRFLRTL